MSARDTLSEFEQCHSRTEHSDNQKVTHIHCSTRSWNLPTSTSLWRDLYHRKVENKLHRGLTLKHKKEIRSK